MMPYYKSHLERNAPRTSEQSFFHRNEKFVGLRSFEAACIHVTEEKIEKPVQKEVEPRASQSISRVCISKCHRRGRPRHTHHSARRGNAIFNCRAQSRVPRTKRRKKKKTNEQPKNKRRKPQRACARINRFSSRRLYPRRALLILRTHTCVRAPL